MNIHAVPITKANADKETFEADPTKVIAGSSAQAIWNAYTDRTGRLSAGVWKGAVGKWRVNYTEEEFCYLLRGLVEICDESGNGKTFGAGDAFVVPSGFSGTWEDIEPTEKLYVVSEESD